MVAAIPSRRKFAAFALGLVLHAATSSARSWCNMVAGRLCAAFARRGAYPPSLSPSRKPRTTMVAWSLSLLVCYTDDDADLTAPRKMVFRQTLNLVVEVGAALLT